MKLSMVSVGFIKWNLVDRYFLGLNTYRTWIGDTDVRSVTRRLISMTENFLFSHQMMRLDPSFEVQVRKL